MGKFITAAAHLRRAAESNRFGALYLAAALYILISSTTRLILALHEIVQEQIRASALFALMPIGIAYDFITCLYLFAPFALYLLLAPQRIFRLKAQRVFMTLAFFATAFGLLYLGAVEYFFFDEFHARFNFIAVEYLIYPHEVFTNIWESYPVAKALLAVSAITTVLYWRLRHPLDAAMLRNSPFSTRVRPVAVFAALLLIAHAGVNISTGRYSDNRVANELAQNGIYSFFNAVINSQLDYREYYLTVADTEAAERLRKLVAQPNATFIPNSANPIARHIHNPGEPKQLNVIVLLQESLGAEFVGAYGDRRGLTPNLDRVAQDSLMFTNVYATGTRTVRGMEAVAASFPPVPPESIVKRPHNENMFNWSTVMAKSGYTPTFVYGGYGSFDNMNYFFGHNGYKVVDRTDMDEPKFSNIWGVSDEDLFRNALRVFDGQHARGEKIFSIVMSTSNHKPFTFPEGIPGVKATGGGREAAVRYADYAIGKFIETIRTKPYFDDTLIVVIADHGARIYGKEDFPLRSYELPFLVYSPKHVKPGKVDILASQTDVAPTILGMLNISYDSVFFGRDIFTGNPEDRFVVLNHNRDIAILTPGRLTELSFRKGAATYLYDKPANRQVRTERDEERIKDAASVFQAAYDFYVNARYTLPGPYYQFALAAEP